MFSNFFKKKRKIWKEERNGNFGVWVYFNYFSFFLTVFNYLGCCRFYWKILKTDFSFIFPIFYLMMSGFRGLFFFFFRILTTNFDTQFRIFLLFIFLYFGFKFLWILLGESDAVSGGFGDELLRFFQDFCVDIFRGF